MVKVHAGPCSRCKYRPRERGSYCRICHNELQRQSYRARKTMAKQFELNLLAQLNELKDGIAIDVMLGNLDDAVLKGKDLKELLDRHNMTIAGRVSSSDETEKPVEPEEIEEPSYDSDEVEALERLHQAAQSTIRLGPPGSTNNTAECPHYGEDFDPEIDEHAPSCHYYRSRT